MTVLEAVFNPRPSGRGARFPAIWNVNFHWAGAVKILENPELQGPLQLEAESRKSEVYTTNRKSSTPTSQSPGNQLLVVPHVEVQRLFGVIMVWLCR